MPPIPSSWSAQLYPPERCWREVEISAPVIKTNFTTGEIAPGLYGHVDLAKYAGGAATMRNMFVSYRGGAYSRAGTAFVGFSKQTGRAYPPRVVTFQFSNIQGLALEFGHQYMRVVFQGAFVTEAPVNITAATKSNPATVTTAGQGASAATPNNAGVGASYAPADTVTLAGGTFTTAAVLSVTTTELKSLGFTDRGEGYTGGDTITLAGGTSSPAAVLTVVTTRWKAATIDNAGAGGTPGPAVVTGTGGTGTKYQLNVTINGGGQLASIDSVAVLGSYTVNPTSPDPVTGGGLVGASVFVALELSTLAITDAGVFTVNPPGGTLTQASTSGAGINAAFGSAIMAPHALTVATPGYYTVVPTNPVAQASSSGSGTGATFTMSWAGAASFANGDWVAIAGVGGMTQLNGQTYVVSGVSGATFNLLDAYGGNIDSTGFSAYTSGGTAARIYTLATPWAETDLPWLKFVQSADVMSICCWNQSTGTSYPPYDLARLADNDWTLTQLSTASVIAPPANPTGTASDTATPATDYKFVITSVSADGQESIASAIIDIANSVLISATAGSLNLTWDAALGAAYYNVYKALAAYNSTVPPGAIYAYAGQSYGTQFVDSNITPDFALTPPLHQDPFAPGAILGVTLLTGGGSITGAVAIVITTGTGSGFSGYVVINGGVATNVVVETTGTGYLSTDTVAITVGGGTPPTAALVVGPQTGTYPSVPSYFQQRRVYAGTPNNPDTYFMSQPGRFKNFDTRNPPTATDAITGTPWSLQVDGIQFMVPMPGGLLCLNGNSIWQVGGGGSSQLNPQPITPSSQEAQSQEANGISSTVPPIRINQDILYVQSKGAIIRNITYQIFSNNYTGIDISALSSHLFTGYQTIQWAWCQEPQKVVWGVRDDGVLLSLTYLKEESVIAWARHDTNGLFQSVCSVTEPPVDALYLAAQRFLGGHAAYMIERMDNRLWNAAEDSWCVDCGLKLDQPTPSAAISATSPTGLGAISGFTGLVGGHNYSATTTASIVDNNGNGPGTGAVATLTIVAGVITAVGGGGGTLYVNPAMVISDPTGHGSGASAIPTLDNSATFVTSAPVFNSGMVGWIIRMGGGIARITAYTDNEHVTANILSPITAVMAADPPAVIPQGAGEWTLTKPTTTITGLNHLIGAPVMSLADGVVISPTVVAADGSISLVNAASAVIVGLGFTAQLQTPYLMDYGGFTEQGQRKRITRATARVEASRGILIGANQPDGSAIYPLQLAPAWVNLTPLTDLPGSTSYNALCPALWTGDSRVPVPANFDKPGQVCFQQSNPLPMQILAVIPEILAGDTPQPTRGDSQQAQRRRGSWRR